MGVSQLTTSIKPQNVFPARPGPVGSVGDVLVKSQGRRSHPDLPLVFNKNVKNLGVNVQDGSEPSIIGAGPANCDNGAFRGNRSFKHAYGYTYHDIQNIDKLTEPVLAPQGDVSWRSKIARPRIIKRTGQLFSIKPMGYQAAGPLRGGNYPVVETSGGIEPASVAPVEKDPIELESNPLRRGATATGRQGFTRPTPILMGQVDK
jgi:hypothetical protein